MLASRLAPFLLVLAARSCEWLDSLGCTERRAVREVPPAQPWRASSLLPSLPLQLDLPDDATVQVIDGSVVMTIHPGRRTPLRIDIKQTVAVGAIAGQGVRKRTLTPQLQIIYREQVQSGGSGGDEAILDGELTLGSEYYRVTCRQQSEYAASASDCLPVLATLRSLAR